MARILVVDDEVGIRELLSEILNDEGHEVVSAENAQSARSARATQHFDAILLDIWMPDTDGVTLLKEWAGQNALAATPVIMMSGHGTIDTAVEATRIGAIDFLEKPITLTKLLKAVSVALNRGKAPAVAARPASVVQAAPVVVASASGMMPSVLQAVTAEPAIAPSPPGLDLPLDAPLREARDAFERVYFEHHLAREGWSMTRVAERTGLERTHLYRKLKQLGIELARKKAEANSA
ncbi:XRE family transcriptional regulator [beta proteobacterium AAP99]|nr:XRE family transcriptional regulator [beta proteobacterium AAP99]